MCVCVRVCCCKVCVCALCSSSAVPLQHLCRACRGGRDRSQSICECSDSAAILQRLCSDSAATLQPSSRPCSASAAPLPASAAALQRGALRLRETEGRSKEADSPLQCICPRKRQGPPKGSERCSASLNLDPKQRAPQRKRALPKPKSPLSRTCEHSEPFPQSEPFLNRRDPASYSIASRVPYLSSRTRGPLSRTSPSRALVNTRASGENGALVNTRASGALVNTRASGESKALVKTRAPLPASLRDKGSSIGHSNAARRCSAS